MAVRAKRNKLLAHLRWAHRTLPREAFSDAGMYEVKRQGRADAIAVAYTLINSRKRRPVQRGPKS